MGEQSYWRETILPEIINATPNELIGQVSVYYELHAKVEDRRDSRGAPLTAESIRHIKDVLPAEARGFIDFLLFKFCDDPDTRTALNLTKGNSRLSRAHCSSTVRCSEDSRI
jgi:hypothetical protein